MKNLEGAIRFFERILGDEASDRCNWRAFQMTTSVEASQKGITYMDLLKQNYLDCLISEYKQPDRMECEL